MPGFGRAWVNLDVYTCKHLSLFAFTYAWKNILWSKEENHDNTHCNGGLDLTAKGQMGQLCTESVIDVSYVVLWKILYIYLFSIYMYIWI